MYVLQLFCSGWPGFGYEQKFIYYILLDFLVPHFPLSPSPSWSSSSGHFGIFLGYFLSRLSAFQGQVRLPSQPIPDIQLWATSPESPSHCNLQFRIWSNSPPSGLFLFILLSQQHSLLPPPTYSLTYIVRILLSWHKFLAYISPVITLEDWKHL